MTGLLDRAELMEFAGLSSDALAVLEALRIGPKGFILGRRRVWRESEVLAWCGRDGALQADLKAAMSVLVDVLVDLERDRQSMRVL